MERKNKTKSKNNDTLPQYLNQTELDRLAADPTNRVYQYTNDDPTATFTTDQQKRYIAEIRNRYLQIKQSEPTWNDEKIRDQLKSENSMWESFAENNGRIFDTCSSKDSTEDHLNHIKYCVKINIIRFAKF